MPVLVLNCGSSSVKYALIDPATGERLAVGLGERLGTGEAVLVSTIGAAKDRQPLPGADHATALRAVVALLTRAGLLTRIDAVGHRVVHGGERFTASCLITAEVVAGIDTCAALAPLHNPPNLVGIRLAQELFPRLAQVAVFDTAFHASLTPEAYHYALPWSWYAEHGVRRYGFHGTSHRYVADAAVRTLRLDPADHALVIAHLGNGCSATAVRDGRSIDTTMGLTPLEGLVMGTRCGSVDPAIVTHMTAALGQDAAQVMAAMNRDSGLLGLSGRSNDMRTLLADRAAGHERAGLAIAVFCRTLAKAIAALAVPLGRLDGLVFTGGIGENAAPIRAEVVGRLGLLGLTLDETANAAHGRQYGGRISRPGGPLVAVVPTDEELLIARDTAACTTGKPGEVRRSAHSEGTDR